MKPFSDVKIIQDIADEAGLSPETVRCHWGNFHAMVLAEQLKNPRIPIPDVRRNAISYTRWKCGLLPRPSLFYRFTKRLKSFHKAVFALNNLFRKEY